MLWLPDRQEGRRYLLDWAQQRLPYVEVGFDEGTSYPIAVMRGDQIAFVAVYHQWRGCNVEVSAAADTPRWATRETIRAVFDWPFDRLNVRRVTAIIASRNERSRKIVNGIGFVQEGVLRDVYPDDDAVIYGLLRRYWRRSRWCRQEERKAA